MAGVQLHAGSRLLVALALMAPLHAVSAQTIGLGARLENDDVVIDKMND
jgi:hypothetical protein